MADVTKEIRRQQQAVHNVIIELKLLYSRMQKPVLPEQYAQIEQLKDVLLSLKRYTRLQEALHYFMEGSDF